MVSFNGAITWIAARFKGNHKEKLVKILEVLRKCIKMNPYIILFPQMYLVLMVSIILPRSVILKFEKVAIKLFEVLPLMV